MGLFDLRYSARYIGGSKFVYPTTRLLFWDTYCKYHNRSSLRDLLKTFMGYYINS